jgi:hypothetical protein
VALTACEHAPAFSERIEILIIQLLNTKFAVAFARTSLVCEKKIFEAVSRQRKPD